MVGKRSCCGSQCGNKSWLHRRKWTEEDNILITRVYAPKPHHPWTMALRITLAGSRRRLVHWCQGAPGFIPLLARAAGAFPADAAVLTGTAVKAGEVVWERGLLKKVGMLRALDSCEFIVCNVLRVRIAQHSLSQGRLCLQLAMWRIYGKERCFACPDVHRKQQACAQHVVHKHRTAV